MTRENISVYQRKVKACEILVNKNSKRITKSHFYSVANDTGLKPSQVERAWGNFVQSGGAYIDARKRSSCPSNPMPVINGKKNPSQKGLANHVDAATAKKIIYEFMTTNNSLVAVANSHGVCFRAAYDWIHELSVSGTICGEMILDVRKYAKLPVIDVIHFYKHPKTKKISIATLNETKKLAYKRVAAVLLKYLVPETV